MLYAGVKVWISNAPLIHIKGRILAIKLFDKKNWFWLKLVEGRVIFVWIYSCKGGLDNKFEYKNQF
jgi:hypothetical protein